MTTGDRIVGYGSVALFAILLGFPTVTGLWTQLPTSIIAMVIALAAASAGFAVMVFADKFQKIRFHDIALLLTVTACAAIAFIVLKFYH